MKTKMNFILMVLGFLSLVACAPDKNAEEFEREKRKENLSLYESVAGRYTGVLVSKVTGQPIGALEVFVQAKTVVGNPGGGGTAPGTPYLVSNFRFRKSTTIEFVANNGFLDPDTKEYSTQVQITRPTGAEVVDVSGVFTSNQLRGQLVSRDFASMGATFLLDKNGRALEEIPLPPTNPDQDSQVNAFLGGTFFLKENPVKEKSLRLVILKVPRGSIEDLMEEITPIRSIRMSLNYGKSLRILSKQTFFDERQGLLIGQVEVNTGDGQVQVLNSECRITMEVQPNTGGKLNRVIRCSHYTTAAGIVAKSELWKNDNSEDPADPAEGIISERRSYVGRGLVDGKYRTMKMDVTLPPRSRIAELLELFFPISERLVNVAIYFTETTTANLTDIKFDGLNKLLDGKNNFGPYTAYIRCPDFNWYSPTCPQKGTTFTCVYHTSRTPEIPIQFDPPYGQKPGNECGARL